MNDSSLRRFSFASFGAPALAGALIALTAFGPSPARAEGEAPAPEFPAEGVTPPALRFKVAPLYPDAARRDGVAGIVLVAARVGRDGLVREARVAYSIAALDAAALEAALGYVFTPASDGGQEVENWVAIPVRFDESLPRGARTSDPVAAETYGAPERTFESDVAVLLQLPPGLPDTSDVELREQLMRDALNLDVIPPPPPAAVQAFHAGDSLAASPEFGTRARAEGRWLAAAHDAPWWPDPLMRLAAAALAQRNFAATERCVSVVLAARPGDPYAQALLRRTRSVKLAVAHPEPKKR